MQSGILYSGSTTLPQIRGHFTRSRINKLFDTLLERYLIVVTAGAGSGKTHAVASYLQNTELRVFWFQLSVLDNDLSRFWEAFLHVMESQNAEIAQQLEQLGFPETVLKFNRFLHILAKEIYSREQVVFVFDDFHLIHDESILRFVQNLIFAKLENLCIIINSRTAPRFNVTRLLADDFAGQITTEDLYFTAAETQEYLRRQDISLSTHEMAKVQGFTGGWPLALYLVGLSMKKGGVITRDPIAGAVPLIFEMLENELFSGYSPQIQRFLIRCSLLNAFPEGLVLMLAGEHRDEVLEFIGSNMFINSNPYSGQYIFHHLFLEFLSEKQRVLTAGEMMDTYLKAARWCSENDLKIDALYYYDKCGRHDEILNIIFNFGVAIFSKSVAEFYISLIDKFPAEIMEKNPSLHIHRAGLLYNNAEVELAIAELLETQRELEKNPSPESRAVLGELHGLLGLIYLGMANYDFVGHLQKFCEYLPDGSAMINNHGAAVNTRYAIMLSSTAAGELERMERALSTVISANTKAMRGYGQGMDYLASAEAAFLTGGMKKAEKNAYEAIYRAREKHVADVATSGYFLLMRICAAAGDYEGVTKNLGLLRNYVEGHEDKWNFNGMPDVADGWFNLLFGSTDKVAGWLVSEELGSSLLAPYSMGMERSIKARCLLREGKYYELLAWLEQTEKPIRQYNILLILLDILICKSIALHRVSDEPGSYRALLEAYEIANGNGLVMQFAELGNDIRAVIYSAKRNPDSEIPDKWLDEIYAKAGTYEKHLRAMRTQHERGAGAGSSISQIKLTKRERELLVYLCQGLTNSEIASACFVTVSAVKKTLNKIYIKLDATNRADAVRTAIQMELNK